MTIEIPLNSKKYPGYVALVDDEDYELVSMYRWSPKVDPRAQTVYAYTGKHLMHRLILPGVAEVDHENGNGLDNRRSNLRPSTHTENRRNSRLNANNTSGFKGVRWYKRTGRWIAGINVGGKLKHLGYFDDPIEAATAYDVAAIEHFGEFARLNFSDSMYG